MSDVTPSRSWVDLDRGLDDLESDMYDTRWRLRSVERDVSLIHLAMAMLLGISVGALAICLAMVTS